MRQHKNFICTLTKQKNPINAYSFPTINIISIIIVVIRKNYMETDKKETNDMRAVSNTKETNGLNAESGTHQISSAKA